MEYKNIKDFDNYILYENGDVYNIKRNKQMKSRVNNGHIQIGLNNNNNKKKDFTLARLIYECFYNEKVTNSEIIKFKDEK